SNSNAVLVFALSKANDCSGIFKNFSSYTQHRLEEREEKSRKRTPRLEDLHLISCLQKKLNEKEEMIKELMQKKMDEAAPSCIVTVPKLASYAKSFLSGELRPKRTQPQNIKSMVLDQNLGCVQVCCPSVLVLENRPLS
ncbi:hypothetical protein E2320_022885, partial [Naja naja]